MNREILFRAKRIDNGEWVEGSIYIEKHPFKGQIIQTMIVEYRPDLCLVSGAPDNNHWWREVNPSSVGQFTGLTDKNGKRIFEGDKIYIEEYNEKRTGIIVADLERTGFKIEWLTKTEFNEYIHVRIDNIEVIGTIHDEPTFI